MYLVRFRAYQSSRKWGRGVIIRSSLFSLLPLPKTSCYFSPSSDSTLETRNVTVQITFKIKINTTSFNDSYWSSRAQEEWICIRHFTLNSRCISVGIRELYFDYLITVKKRADVVRMGNSQVSLWMVRHPTSSNEQEAVSRVELGWAKDSLSGSTSEVDPSYRYRIMEVLARLSNRTIKHLFSWRERAKSTDLYRLYQ